MNVTPLRGPAYCRVMDWRCEREGDQRWGSFAGMGQRRPRANPRPPLAAGFGPGLVVEAADLPLLLDDGQLVN